jgi:PAS domain S-box-containing protein
MSDLPHALRKLDIAAALLAALDSAPIGVSMTVSEGSALYRLYGNRALAGMIGADFEDFLSGPPMATVAPEERERMQGFVDNWDHARPMVVETKIVAKDGTRVPVEVRVGAVTVEGKHVAVNFLTDLTERQRMEQAVRDSEARFRLLCEGCPDTITVFSDGRMVYANPAAVKLLGFDSPEELMARPVSELVVADEVELMRARMGEVARGALLVPVEYRGRCKDGSVVSMEISSIAIQFRGKPAILGVGRDTTERKRLQAELMRADRMATVGTLAAGVAHEVNNPLTYVLIHLRRLRGMLPELASGHRDRDRVEQLLSEAESGAERVARIVRDLLAFARPGGEEPQPVVVQDVWESVLHLAASSIDGNAKLVRHFGIVPPAMGDPARMAQVFLNLLLNAVQSLEGKDPQRSEIVITVGSEGDHIRVDVDDNGPGIPEALRTRVFEPFFTTKAPGRGTGLGLAISRTIVEAYGGSIEVGASPAGGARLTLLLRTWRGQETP